MIVTAKKSAREVKQSQGVCCPPMFHRPQINPCSNVANYPAGAAFFISSYKIYVVCLSKRYKSNIFSNATARRRVVRHRQRPYHAKITDRDQVADHRGTPRSN